MHRILFCILFLFVAACSTEESAISKPVLENSKVTSSSEVIKGWYQFMIDKKPSYVMSDKIKPDDDISVGVDCSRYLFLVYKWSGFAVRRVTARDMAHGLGNWVGVDVKPDDADELDILWWTWKDKPERPFGHVGAVLLFKNGMFGVTHASAGRGHIVHDKYEGVLVRDLAKARRITLDGGKK